MKATNNLITESKQISFLPEPIFNPTYPLPHTLSARCLSLMLSGKTFTHPEFEQETGSWRLAVFINILKNLGWPIESHELAAPTSDAPARYISRYFLPQKIIEAVYSEVRHD